MEEFELHPGRNLFGRVDLAFIGVVLVPYLLVSYTFTRVLGRCLEHDAAILHYRGDSGPFSLAA